MYNWENVSKHYYDCAGQFGKEIMEDEEFSSYYLQNIASVLRITRNIAQSPMWDNIQIKGAAKMNVVDMMASLFMGIAMPLNAAKEIEPSIETLKETIDFYTNAREDEVLRHLSDAMRQITPNINDVLVEFQNLFLGGQEYHYFDMVKIMYLSGIFMGNAFLRSANDPDGKMEPNTNIFAPYIAYLEGVFANMDNDRKR